MLGHLASGIEAGVSRLHQERGWAGKEKRKLGANQAVRAVVTNSTTTSTALLTAPHNMIPNLALKPISLSRFCRLKEVAGSPCVHRQSARTLASRYDIVTESRIEQAGPVVMVTAIAAEPLDREPLQDEGKSQLERGFPGLLLCSFLWGKSLKLLPVSTALSPFHVLCRDLRPCSQAYLCR